MTAVNDIKKPTVQAEALPTIPKKSERNMGVELFRIVSMMLVVMLHIINQGGLISASGHLTVNYKIVTFLQVMTYCSVNCYAIISGYANAKTKFKFRRFIYLWLETVVLILSVTALVHFFVPSVEVTRDWWLNGLFPVTRRELWYLCAYFFMFPLIPVMNKGLESLTKWQHVAVIFLLQAPTVFRLIVHTDNYVLGGGYSAIWLICLYVIGAYFRFYGAPKWAKWFVTLPVFFLATFVAWFNKIHAETALQEGLIDKTADAYANRGDLISYVSPCMVIMAVMLLLFFMQVKVRFKVSKLIIANLGKATWGVFVIHVTSAFWYWRDFWKYFRKFSEFSAWKLILALFLATIVLYLGFSLFSLARILLFKLIRANKGIEFVADLPEKAVTYIKAKCPQKKETAAEKAEEPSETAQ